MSVISSRSIDYSRRLASSFNSRPLGALLLINKEFPNSAVTYTVTIAGSNISLSNGSTTFSVAYVDKSIAQVAQELSNSPFPIQVKSLADIQQLSAGELLASGSIIPNSFDVEDRSNDGRGAIVRCTRFSVLYNNISVLSLKAPYFTNSTLPWWPRITNGSFSQRYNGIMYHFGIPEYADQVWSSTMGRPYVDVEGELAQFINSHSIKLNRSPVLWKNNIVLTSTSGDRIYSSSVIKDVDTINGIIYLDPSVTLPKDIFIYYTYYEKSFTYKGINLNGHFSQNPYILNKYVVFYALPIKSNAGGHRATSIGHSIGSSIEDAIYNITSTNAKEPISIIGAINVQSATSADDVSIVDTRVYGGGLHSNSLGRATEKRFKESQYFFDIGHKEGIPYPGTAAIVVELPNDLKEVLSVAEIRDRTRKFIAAGVYPIIKYRDDIYFDQFQSNQYNVDISLLDYSFSYSNTGLAQSIFGQTGQASYIINSAMTVPTGLLSTYDATGCRPNPWLENGILKLEPGDLYKVSYLKGSADAIFSYEWRSQNAEWERVTIKNDVNIPTGQLSCQSFTLDARYGYREIRNLTGFSSYILSEDFVDDALLSCSKIIERTKLLSNTYTLTGSVENIYNTTLSLSPTGTIELSPLIEPLLVNYNTLYSNWYSFDDIPLLSGNAAVFYSGTTGNTFPLPYNYLTNSYGSAYSGTYNAMRDLHAYARYANGRINEVDNLNTSNVQALNITGAASWITTNTSNDATYAYSGAIALYNKISSISPFIGNGSINTDIITPFYNPATNTGIALASSYGNSEVGNSNTLMYGAEYIKAYAALYSAQVLPTRNESSHLVCPNLSGKPRNIALSGITSWTSYFNNYFNGPTYQGTGIQHTWLATYNRISTHASRYLDCVCNAIDYLYYGNSAWAGITGYETKSATYYNLTYSPINAFRFDTTWTDVITWPDSDTLTAVESIDRAIDSIHNNLNTIEPYVRSAATHGGILQPDYADAIKYYLWLPMHSGLGDPLFTSTDYSRHIETFEIGMSAILKGYLNEDGVLIEGGSFKYQPASFSGRLPSKIFNNCITAVEFYNTIGNQAQEKKWLAITEGLYRTTEGTYALSGGYPYGPYYNVGTASGDAGSAVLNGYLQFARLLDEPLTSDEFTAITGQVSRSY